MNNKYVIEAIDLIKRSIVMNDLEGYIKVVYPGKIFLTTNFREYVKNMKKSKINIILNLINDASKTNYKNLDEFILDRIISSAILDFDISNLTVNNVYNKLKEEIKLLGYDILISNSIPEECDLELEYDKYQESIIDSIPFSSFEELKKSIINSKKYVDKKEIETLDLFLKNLNELLDEINSNIIKQDDFNISSDYYNSTRKRNLIVKIQEEMSKEKLELRINDILCKNCQMAKESPNKIKLSIYQLAVKKILINCYNKSLEEADKIIDYSSYDKLDEMVNIKKYFSKIIDDISNKIKLNKNDKESFKLIIYGKLLDDDLLNEILTKLSYSNFVLEEQKNENNSEKYQLCLDTLNELINQNINNSNKIIKRK